MSAPTMYQRGDLVWVRLPDKQWQRGIVTDVFRGPVSEREVVVVGGTGYYDNDVVPDFTSDEPAARLHSVKV